MKAIAHPLVVGSVLGGLVTGLIAGTFLDGLAVLVWSGSLAASAAVAVAVCWWRPGLDAAAWKVWLATTFASPLMLASLGWSIAQWECLVGGRTGWECLFAGVGPIVAVTCLPPPLIGLLARRLFRPRPPG